MGRYGGEEFVVVAPHQAGSDASALAERLRAALEEALAPWDVSATVGLAELDDELQLGHEEQASFTASLGLGERFAHAAELLDTLIRNADAALYAGKRAGKNRVVRWRGDDVDADPAVAVA